MRIILWDEVLHWRGFSDDGLNGLSPITVARETMGLALSESRVRGALPGEQRGAGRRAHAQEDAVEGSEKEPPRESWKEQHGGRVNVGKVAILEEEMTWQSIGFNPKDSQFLEQRQFDIEEIARMFDLPPHKLMDLDRSTNNNIEHQGIEYVMDCILPRAVNLEETLERDLLLPSDSIGSHRVQSRGAAARRLAARAAFYNTMFNIGASVPNDIRRKENMNPAEGGDEHFVPLNMVPLKQAAQLLEDQTELDGRIRRRSLATTPRCRPKRACAGALRRRIARAHEPLFVDAIGRTLKKEAQAGRRALAGALAAGVDHAVHRLDRRVLSRARAVRRARARADHADRRRGDRARGRGSRCGSRLADDSIAASTSCCATHRRGRARARRDVAH
jgi:hypothetical protein